MKRILVFLVSAALVAGALYAVPVAAQEAPAVPEKPNIEDPAGDANYVNDQGFGSTIGFQGDRSTPADAGSLSDILKVWFTSDADKINAHIQTEALASGQNAAIFFRVQVDPLGGDPDCLWFQGMTGGLNTPDPAYGSLRDLCGDADETTTEGVEFKMEAGPDNTGIYTVVVPRAAHSAFAEGTKLLAPTAHSRNYNGSAGARAATAPQIDNTKPGTDYVVTSGEEDEPKKDKKGKKKGKGKKPPKKAPKKRPKKGKPKTASCAAFTPGEAGAEKPTITLTDEATEEKPVEQKVTLGMSLANLRLHSAVPAAGPLAVTTDVFNIQVDSKAKEAGVYALLEFPQRRDYDLSLFHPDGSYAARARSFNTAVETPFNNPGHGGEGTDHSEKLVGIKTADCGGWTLAAENHFGEGGDFTVKLWLGEAKTDPLEEGKEKPS